MRWNSLHDDGVDCAKRFEEVELNLTKWVLEDSGNFSLLVL